jgi:hypothetical protein
MFTGVRSSHVNSTFRKDNDSCFSYLMTELSGRYIEKKTMSGVALFPVHGRQEVTQQKIKKLI